LIGIGAGTRHFSSPAGLTNRKHGVSEAVDAIAVGSRKRKPRELTPVQRALALLVRREHSRKELARKLA